MARTVSVLEGEEVDQAQVQVARGETVELVVIVREDREDQEAVTRVDNR